MPGTSIAIAADDAYVPGLMACLHGVTEHASGTEVVIMDCGLSRYSRAAVDATVAGKCSVSFKTPHADIELLRGEGYPSAMYARLLLGRFAFANPRVLYLDADTIVVGSLDDLFRASMDGSPVGAVPDFHTPFVSSRDGLPDWPELGLQQYDSFFNSGVLLVDLALWVSENLEQQLITHAARYKRIKRCNDQHALNASLAGRWHELPPVWNATRYWFKAERRVGAYVDLLEDARIIHFIGPHKPWKLSPDIPAVELDRFFSALDQSALAGWRPREPVTLRHSPARAE
jgi:lipopolysaccharide biosynthesis glycosyltransferase